MQEFHFNSFSCRAVTIFWSCLFRIVKLTLTTSPKKNAKKGFRFYSHRKRKTLAWNINFSMTWYSSKHLTSNASPFETFSYRNGNFEMFDRSAQSDWKLQSIRGHFQMTHWHFIAFWDFTERKRKTARKCVRKFLDQFKPTTIIIIAKHI